MENQIYNWWVKSGNIVLQKNGDFISLQLVYQNGNSCLLTYTDANEFIEILSNISQQIWLDPNYIKTPYAKPLYKKVDDKFYWQIDSSELVLSYNETDDALEIQCNGNSPLNLEINYAIEIIQILEHLNV